MPRRVASQGVALLVRVPSQQVRNVVWWGCVFAVLDRCKYYPSACPSVWDTLVFLVSTRALLPHNFALCLRFLLQLTHLNTAHQAVVGVAHAILSLRAAADAGGSTDAAADAAPPTPSSVHGAGATSASAASAAAAAAAATAAAVASVPVMEARKIVSVEALKLVECMVDSLDPTSTQFFEKGPPLTASVGGSTGGVVNGVAATGSDGGSGSGGSGSGATAGTSGSGGGGSGGSAGVAMGAFDSRRSSLSDGMTVGVGPSGGDADSGGPASNESRRWSVQPSASPSSAGTGE
jgi:hypothetical protein